MRIDRAHGPIMILVSLVLTLYANDLQIIPKAKSFLTLMASSTLCMTPERISLMQKVQQIDQQSTSITTVLGEPFRLRAIQDKVLQII